MGLDYVATWGTTLGRRWDEATGRWQLLRASDPVKDQSYVLYHLTQDTLAHMLFPLGELTKDEVRELARAHGFVTAEKPESQDICFVPDVRLRRGSSKAGAGHVAARERPRACPWRLRPRADQGPPLRGRVRLLLRLQPLSSRARS